VLRGREEWEAGDTLNTTGSLASRVQPPHAVFSLVAVLLVWPGVRPNASRSASRLVG
jgi:hypothetical protein